MQHLQQQHHAAAPSAAAWHCPPAMQPLPPRRTHRRLCTTCCSAPTSATTSAPTSNQQGPLQAAAPPPLPPTGNLSPLGQPHTEPLHPLDSLQAQEVHPAQLSTAPSPSAAHITQQAWQQGPVPIVLDPPAQACGGSTPQETAQSRLLVRWHDRAKQLAEAVAERHTKDRKFRIAELKSEMQQLSTMLPPDLAEQLERQLVLGRAEASRQQKARMQAALETGPQLVVDCSFALQHCRPGLETRSLAKQVEWAMAVNRRSTAPLGLQATSWTGEVARFGEFIGCAGWPVVLHEKHLLDVFPPQQVVILSPDASEPLLQLDPDAVYVVGGIVDRTVRKGLTAGFAATHALRSARLPIAEHLPALGMHLPGVNPHPVLNVSDVLIALMEVHRTGGDWAKALGRVVPERKRRPQEPRVRKPRPQRGRGAAAEGGAGEQEE